MNESDFQIIDIYLHCMSMKVIHIQCKCQLLYVHLYLWNGIFWCYDVFSMGKILEVLAIPNIISQWINKYGYISYT